MQSEDDNRRGYLPVAELKKYRELLLKEEDKTKSEIKKLEGPRIEGEETRDRIRKKQLQDENDKLDMIRARFDQIQANLKGQGKSFEDCDKCNKSIEKFRLVNFPWCNLCIPCKAKKDQTTPNPLRIPIYSK
ncbi:MAG: TraR/DksA C4-type zinc finger protein [Candidatus Pacebacteria bacterium]|nr:TraR/DksA C4-type zinc finger protein [Candidatus Paceibacterota bacterium]